MRFNPFRPAYTKPDSPHATIYPYSQNMIMNEARGRKIEPGTGLCLQLCLIWLVAREQHPGPAVDDINFCYNAVNPIDDDGSITGVLNVGLLNDIVDGQARRIAATAAAEQTVEDQLDVIGLRRDGVSLKRRYVLGRAVSLANRQAVVDHVLNNPGLYLHVIFNSAGAGGHAIAFSTGTAPLMMFDPDNDMVVCPTPQYFREYFCWLWQDEYKEAYKRGQRRLYRYVRT